MKKKFLISALLLILSVLVLSSCGKKTDKQEGYVTDAQREEHILKLLNNNESLLINESDYITAKEVFADSNEWNLLGLKDFVMLTENDSFSLWMNVKDTAIAVYDKSTHNIYHSDPTHSGADTTISGKLGKNQSPISVEAYDQMNKRYEFNFYQNCYEDGSGEMYKIAMLEDGTFRIIYTIGNDPNKNLVSPVFTEGTWDSIHERIEKIADSSKASKYKRALEECYLSLTPETLGIEEREQYLQDYPLLDSVPMRICRKLNTKQKQMVKEIMEAVGFTVEDLKAELDRAEYAGPERSVMYTIPVDIKLTDDGLFVNIDSSLILAPTKQKLYKIYCYRSFGATNSTLTGSYMIIPDGTGTVIQTTGNYTKDSYTARIYGLDKTFTQSLDSEKTADVLTPVLFLERGKLVDLEYDIQRRNGSIMAVLESGASSAFVTARPMNGTSTVAAAVNFDLIYSERDYLTYSGGQGNDSSEEGAAAEADTSNTGVVLSKDTPTANFVVHYIFGEGGYTYSDYARIYREYLQDNGKLPKETIKSAKLQFYVDFYGAFEKTETVAGLPVTHNKPLTTFKQAKEILTKLKDDGVENVNARYLYWANNGYLNTIYDSIDLVSCLGNKSDMKDLVDYISSNGIGFYPDVELQYVRKDTAGDGLNYKEDIARRLDMRSARFNSRNLATGKENTTAETYQSIISADILPKIADSLIKSYDNIVGVKTISLGSLGADINSNYKSTRNINRYLAYDYILETLEKFSDYGIMVEKGNDYVWNIADHILSLPSGSSEYISSNGSIPFIQMVLHGYVYYANDPFNESCDYNIQKLMCLETGSNIYFRWMSEEDTVFINTDYDSFYSLNYNNSYDTAVALYKEIKPVVDKISGLPITEHGAVKAVMTGRQSDVKSSVSADNVFKTVYGDKYTVYVNYNSYSVEIIDDGGNTVSVDAYGYQLIQ